MDFLQWKYIGLLIRKIWRCECYMLFNIFTPLFPNLNTVAHPPLINIQPPPPPFTSEIEYWNSTSPFSPCPRWILTILPQIKIVWKVCLLLKTWLQPWLKLIISSKCISLSPMQVHMALKVLICNILFLLRFRTTMISSRSQWISSQCETRWRNTCTKVWMSLSTTLCWLSTIVWHTMPRILCFIEQLSNLGTRWVSRILCRLGVTLICWVLH